MSVVSAKIGEGATQLVLDTNVNVDFERNVRYLENGDVDVSETHFFLTGDLVADQDPGDLWDALVELAGEPHKLGPKRFQLIVSGETKFDLEPVDCVKSPTVLSFKCDADEGAGVGHFKWSMVVYVKQHGGQVEEGADQPPGLFSFSSSVAVRQVDDVIVRKEWRASAKAKDLGAAYQQVSSFGPTPKKGSGVTREIERNFEDLRVSAVWVWERSRLFDIDCDVEITGYGDSYIEDKRVGGAEANAHLARKGLVYVRVDGTIWGPKETISPPPAHYTATSYLFRETAKEGRFYPKVFDAEQGIYSLRFQERWCSTGGHPGPPDHHGHDIIKQGKNPPADGAL